MNISEDGKQFPQLKRIASAYQAYETARRTAHVNVVFLTAGQLYGMFGAPLGDDARALSVWMKHRVWTTQN